MIKKNTEHPRHAEYLAKKRAYYAANKEHLNARVRAWNKANPEKSKESQRQARAKRPEHYKKYAKEYRERWRLKNTERYRFLRRRWYYKHQKEILAKQKAIRVSIREEMMAEYGRECACCGENQPEFLTLDHINNDGYKERGGKGGPGGTSFFMKLKRRGWPKGTYQVLCYNCNAAKAFFGVCPHRRLKSEVA